MSPLVPASRRCTTPRRSAAPDVEIRKPPPANPPTTPPPRRSPPPPEGGPPPAPRRFVHDHDVFVIVDDIHAGNDNGFNTQHSWCLPRHGQPRIRMQSI